MSLDIYLLPDEWDERRNRVKSKHPNSARINNVIAKKLADAQDTAFEMQSKDINTTTNKIKEKIKGKASGSFTEYFNSYAEKLLHGNKIGTYNKVRSTGAKLNVFVNNRNLQFEDIDVEFLKKYETYLLRKLGNAINTVHGTIKVIRKLYNDATREGIITVEQNPFLRFRLKSEKTTKVYLTEDELAQIDSLELEEGSILDKHRDLFVFACDAGGIRVSDLLMMKWLNFTGTHVILTMQKTNELISVPLSKKALKILAKYNVDNPKPTAYIFPVMKAVGESSPMQLHKAISSGTAFLNKSLKQIEIKAKLNKHISMHTSRHTWATRALHKGMRIEYVSKLMGHSDIKTTQIYAKIVNAELDKAMEVFND